MHIISLYVLHRTNYKHLFLKGTKVVIKSDPPVIMWHVGFKSVPFDPGMNEKS